MTSDRSLEVMKVCPGCGKALVILATAYGYRVTCPDEGRRWTFIWGEQDYVEETYSPLTDNCHPEGKSGE